MHARTQRSSFMFQPGVDFRASLFWILWLFAIFVSVFDGYLALQNRTVLSAEELNPAGQLLLQCCGGQVWCLLAAKFTGTVFAASILLLINERKPGWGLPIAGSVAAVQLTLLLFLLLW